MEFAVKGKNGVLPVIVRKSAKPYRWTIGEVALTAVANQERMVPRNFITKDGFGITAAARRYLEPLIAGEAPPPYKNGLPDYVELALKPVKRRLKTQFKV